MNYQIRKAVFPVAGLGSRFLPVTKASPKEMLPIVDKPLIQYAVEEAVAAGIEQLIFVTSQTKRSIEDHFDRNVELNMRLKQAGKLALLKQVENILPKHVQCLYVRQPEPKGLGDAVLCAKTVVGDEPFAVLLADDLLINNCMKEMADCFRERGHSLVGVEKIQPQESKKYGVVAFDGAPEKAVVMTDIVEKPAPEQAPSEYGVAGRYIFTPKIFDFLESTESGVGGEIQLTDAIKALLLSEPVLAFHFSGQRFDCGTKLGYLKATIETALHHHEVADDFRAWLLSQTWTKK
jgi:UTP--glucose-1-phosphate uridylyltransferase